VLHNAELCVLYILYNIVRVVKWAEHLTKKGDTMNAYKILWRIFFFFKKMFTWKLESENGIGCNIRRILDRQVIKTGRG